MTAQRRYDDDEVREIFSRATRDDGEREGMTLAELQEIGAEAGIDPARVARAAAHLEASASATPPTLRVLGVPVSVERAVDLPARLADEDWDRLVVRLRDLFHARGTVLREGSLRSWSNGNLQVLLEPTATGYRLRMRSLSSRVRGRLVGGAALAGSGLALALVSLLSGGAEAGELVSSLVVLGGGGAVLFGSGVGTSSRWRSRRAAEFEEIGALAWSLATRPRRG